MRQTPCRRAATARSMARLASLLTGVLPALALAFALVSALALAPGAARAQSGAQPYDVGPGDVLSVSIFGYADISGDQPVREDGSIALHLLGRIEAGGRTVPEIEDDIARRAQERFQSDASVVVGIAVYRDVFVTGEVNAPGAYPFRPGLSVLKAVALAGGLRGSGATAAGADAARQTTEAQRRAEQARTRLEIADARIAAIDAELSRDGDAEAEGGAGQDGDARTGEPQAELVAMRRTLLGRSVDQATRQSQLALEEAQSMRQRRELIQNQREAVAEQVAALEELASRGLARREQLLDLQITADDYRADELESTAFEARALQTAANAEGQIEIERTRYRQDLLSDRIDAAEDRALAAADYRAAAAYLGSVGGAVPAGGIEALEPVYEILRVVDGESRRIEADAATALRPDDVLTVVQPQPEILAPGR